MQLNCLKVMLNLRIEAPSAVGIQHTLYSCHVEQPNTKPIAGSNRGTLKSTNKKLSKKTTLKNHVFTIIQSSTCWEPADIDVQVESFMEVSRLFQCFLVKRPLHHVWYIWNSQLTVTDLRFVQLMDITFNKQLCNHKTYLITSKNQPSVHNTQENWITTSYDWNQWNSLPMAAYETSKCKEWSKWWHIPRKMHVRVHWSTTVLWVRRNQSI